MVCEGAAPSIIVILIIVADLLQLLEVELVAQDTSDTTEALDELVTFGGAVGDKLEVGTEFAEVLGQPLEEGQLVNDLHLLASLGIHELLTVLLLQLVSVENDGLTLTALQLPASDFQVLEHDESLGSTSFESLESVLNTVADLATVHADLVKVLVDELLLLDELDVAESLGGQLNSLVEAVLTTVGDIDNLDDLGLQTTIEQLGLVEVVLEVGATCQDETGAVALVVGDEVLHRQFGDLADVVVTLLLTQTRETQSGLTATAVLLGQIDGELLQDLSGIAGEGTEKGTVSVHDDEAILGVGLEQLAQSLGVELVVTEVEGGVDGLEGLEIDVDLPLLALGGDDFTTVDDQTVRRDLGVQLEPLLGGGDGGQDGQAVDTRLDVGRGSELFSQHLGGAGHLVLGRDDEGNHGGSIAAGGFQALDELLDLPDLDVLVGLVALAGALLFGGHFGGCNVGLGVVEAVTVGEKSAKSRTDWSRGVFRSGGGYCRSRERAHTRRSAQITLVHRHNYNNFVKWLAHAGSSHALPMLMSWRTGR